MPVVEIQNLIDFRQKLSSAGPSKLVVCDFYADWQVFMHFSKMAQYYFSSILHFEDYVKGKGNIARTLRTDLLEFRSYEFGVER